MPATLKLSIGQHSDAGRKETNQDFHGSLIPEEPLLSSKGATIALADGISSSSVSHIAAESAIKGFLTDYYCTSEAWSVRNSAYRVIAATNSWLYSQTKRSQNPYDRDKGYVCTLSVMVVKSNTAYLFHIGDARIYRLSGGTLEQLTNDHRIRLSSHETYLARAMGMNQQIEIDYHTIGLERGDTFILATDGVYEHVDGRFIAKQVESGRNDLDQAAAAIVKEALARGSEDNLTLQIVRIDELPQGEAAELIGQSTELPSPPLLAPRALFEGYRIVRQLHASHRSHIYLAEDVETGQLVALKIPSIDLREDPTYRTRFMMEEWVARRIDNAHVLKPYPQSRKRNYLYVVSEYVEGQTLGQWMLDHPKPDLASMRSIIEQIARGLRSFHRKEMLHQDLRPANIMIDRTGTVKIIDFGSTRVAGVLEATPTLDGADILGTAQYTAPEYYLGEGGTVGSDIYSLGVIAYQMLTGDLPYGTAVPGARTRMQQRKLQYVSAVSEKREIPLWVDCALRRAVEIDPAKRYETLSEFVEDLKRPSERFLSQTAPPLLDRNPLMFWKVLSLFLAMVIVALLLGRQTGTF